MDIIKGKTYDPFCIKRSSDENSILLNHGVYLRSEADISDMVTMDRSDLEMLLDENAQKEASVWQQIERLMDEYKVDAWYVTYWLTYNSPLNSNAECIAKVDDKRFTDYEAMLKYIAGRKKAYAKYFTEISPAIPKNKANLFSVCGTLLPGYSVKEE